MARSRLTNPQPLVEPTDALRSRFWAKVTRPEHGCWEWQGTRLKKSPYGHFGIGGKLFLAHRVAYWLSGGTIDGTQILHRCDNPACCRIEHLFRGTHAENMADKVAKGRQRNGNRDKTHCLRGHELNSTNCLVLRNGDRRCRVCHRARVKASSARRQTT